MNEIVLLLHPFQSGKYIVSAESIANLVTPAELWANAFYMETLADADSQLSKEFTHTWFVDHGEVVELTIITNVGRINFPVVHVPFYEGDTE